VGLLSIFERIFLLHHYLKGEEHCEAFFVKVLFSYHFPYLLRLKKDYDKIAE